MPSVRFSELLGEAFRSAFARPFVFLIAGLTVGALCLGATLLEVHALRSVEATKREHIGAGTNVLVVDADGSPIPASGCARMEGSSSVLNAGALVSLSYVRLADGGSNAFQFAAVSDGYFRVVAPQRQPEHSTVVGSAVADTIGVRPGSLLEFTDGRSLRVGASMLAGSRTADRDRWIYQIAPPSTVGDISECWVESRNGELEETRAQVPVLFGDVDGLRVRSLVSTDVIQSAQSAYDARLTRWAWIPVAFVCAGLVMIVLRNRQPEYAIYRIVGFSATDVVMMFMLEAWLITVPWSGAFMVAALNYFQSMGEIDVRTIAMMAATSGTVLSAALSVLALFSAAIWKADLSRYLKGRG